MGTCSNFRRPVMTCHYFYQICKNTKETGWERCSIGHWSTALCDRGKCWVQPYPLLSSYTDNWLKVFTMMVCRERTVGEAVHVRDDRHQVLQLLRTLSSTDLWRYQYRTRGGRAPEIVNCCLVLTARLTTNVATSGPMTGREC